MSSSHDGIDGEEWELLAVTPVDGRYRSKTQTLSAYFSEYALFKYRVLVEVEYLIALSTVVPQLAAVTEEHKAALRGMADKFSVSDAKRTKEHEKKTNHDMKAVEYFIKEVAPTLQPPLPADCLEFIHFALTSQDINNTAIPLMLKKAVEESFIPAVEDLLLQLRVCVERWQGAPMLARTHGQPATPTTVGKELQVFIERLEVQLGQLRCVPYTAKFSGATGGFNAHHVAFPTVNWPIFADEFIGSLGLRRSQFTTQIEHYDNIAALFDNVRRINTILIDFSRDMWTYISIDYFKQEVKENEVGSSAMPHKVNPIDFENAEGNLGISSALCEHLAHKLPISRMQRDLTDSTVLRNVGVPFAHTLIALQSLKRGVAKLRLNQQRLVDDLEANWAVCAEAVQTILRREGYPKPYEALKAATRGQDVTRESLIRFIETLKGVSEAVKDELNRITPITYGPVWPTSGEIATQCTSPVTTQPPHSPISSPNFTSPLKL